MKKQQSGAESLISERRPRSAARIGSVRRTLRSLQRRLPQEPQEGELLLVSVLQRSISQSESTPLGSPSRPSVIRRTPSTSPINSPGPKEPVPTPVRKVSEDNNSVFGSPSQCELNILTTPAININGIQLSSRTEAIYNSSISDSTTGERLDLFKLPVTASHFPRMTDQETLLATLDDLEHELAYSYRNFPVSSLDHASLVQDYEDTLKLLNESVKSFSKHLRCLERIGGLETLDDWKTKLQKHEHDLANYRRQLRQKITTLKEGDRSRHDDSTPVAETLGDSVGNPVLESGRIQRLKKIALETAKGSISSIKQDLQELNREFTGNLDWAEAEDHEVQEAMKSLKPWKEKLSKTKKSLIELESKVKGEELDDLTADLERLKIQVSKTEKGLDDATAAIQEADEDKGLFTNRISKSSPVQLPSFGGFVGEDLLDFEEKFEKAVKANKIPKSDQLEKLKEVLKGKAKAQVPAKTESIDRAWELLRSAFGDPMTLLKHRKMCLAKIGEYPESFTKTNPQKIVDWCLELEVVIADLLKLGDREERLEMAAFNDDTLNTVIDLFPMRLVFKMEELDSAGREKLEAIADLLESERKVLQKMASRTTQTMGKSRKPPDPPPKSTGHRVNKLQPKGLSMFSGPRKLPNCRICQELEKRGDNQDLYESHQGNYATHCPRWAGMTNEERYDVAKAAKLCLFCMDPKVVFNGGNTGTKHKCITNGTKNRFSCSVDRCCFHSWVCLRHKDQNKSILEKFVTELQRRNMIFTFVVPLQLNVVTEGNDRDPPVTPPGPEVSSSNPAKINLKLKRNPDNDLPLPVVIEKLKDKTPSGEELSVELKDQPLFMFSSTPGKDWDVQIFYDTGNSHVLFKEGTPPNLYGVRTRTGPFALGAVGNTTVWSGDEWACQPMTTKGHREILIGLCVPQITSNFPRINLKEATKEIKESCPENEEVQKLCVPDYVGGECHILLGIQYAAHFPRLVHSLESGLGIYEVKLKPHSSRFTAALAGPHKSFTFLAEKVGNVSFLLKKFTEGISYWKSCGAPAPKGIALTQEELKMAKMLNIGEVASCTNEDVDQLIEDDAMENLSLCCSHATLMPMPVTPTTSSTPRNCPDAPTKQPKGLHKRLTTDTDENFLDEAPQNHLKSCSSKRLISETKEGFLDDIASLIPAPDCIILCCSLCGEPANLSHDSGESILKDVLYCSQSNLSGENLCIQNKVYTITTNTLVQDDVDNATLRQFITAHDSPLRIEYRCPACRNCTRCRESVDTEKISLREEAEEAEIKSSVKLDFKNKRFVCKLPLRGKIEDFLSTNKTTAEKVLEKQCKIYSNDETTRDMIVSSMMKLFNRGHVQLLKEIPEEVRFYILSQPVQYYIPWRPVFKKSHSTPARPVFDCSSKTPLRPDKTGGRCLNDLMAKGRFLSLNLVKMLLRFTIGTHALSGDLKNFYNCFKLLPEFWNLQLFLWKKNMDPSEDTEIAVVKTLIYGNKASAPQSEEGMRQLAAHIRKFNPKLADFLTNCRFVDDLNGSEASKSACDQLQIDADQQLGLLGVESKGWGRTGEAPPPEISDDGSLGVAGLTWWPLMDCLEVKISSLHFGSVSRGKLSSDTQIFDGNFGLDLDSMEKFVPQSLTKKMIVSKFMGVFDLLGKLVPLTSRMKRDMRAMMKGTPSWDSVVAPEHRTIWVKNFLDLEKARGYKFSRPRMPVDAIDTKMRLLVLVDAAKELIVIWAGVGFKRKNGTWSCAQLIGRSLLTSADSTTPRDEMEALVAGSNLLWLLRQMLVNWVDSFLLAGDAQIPLFWTLSDKKRLGVWHRSRSVQIRRGTPLENLYHVTTDCNIADGPTRPDKICFETDLGPGSNWEEGLSWMTMDLNDIVAKGILTPALSLVMQPDQQKDFEEGLVLERTHDILVQGHESTSTDPRCHVACQQRMELVSTRALFSKYLLLPTKYSFPKVVRIVAIVAKFCEAFKQKWKKGYSDLPSRRTRQQDFQVFHTPFTGDNYYDATPNLFPFEVSGGSATRLPLVAQFSGMSSFYSNGNTMNIKLSEDDFQDALHYYYKKATAEVVEFNKREVIEKLAVKREDVLYHKARIMEGQRFVQAGDLEGTDILRSQGINILTPLIDRWSPLAYSIGHHVHTEVAKHSGYETCFRTSHAFVHILKGFSLFREIAEDCVTCLKLRKTFIEASFGPVHSSKFTVAPPFWVTQADIWGPINVFVPGREKNTRNTAALTAKVYAMVFVCCVSKLVNIQIVETKDAQGMCDGLTRLMCEQGAPAHLLVDQDTALLKILKDGEVDLMNLEMMIKRKTKIQFSVCPVSGHNYHGLVEAKIKTAQAGLEKSGASNTRLHATGMQTLAKLIEVDLNNTPFGVTCSRSDSNTPLLKLLSPQMMRMGRINSRNPLGPFKLPDAPRTLLDRVEACYKLWFNEYRDTLLLKYLLDLQPKWFKSSVDTKVQDCVYFRKHEGKLAGDWQLGTVEEVVRSKDGKIRRVTIRYFNASEEQPRFTDRSVRAIVKLFNVEDSSWLDDMAMVQKKLASCGIDVFLENGVDSTAATSTSPGDDSNNFDYSTAYNNFEVIADAESLPCGCCCEGHHQFRFHAGKPAIPKVKHVMPLQSWEEELTIGDDSGNGRFLDLAPGQMHCYADCDSFLNCMLSFNTDFEI